MDRAKLVAKYPKIQVFNKTAHSQLINYEGGETTQIQPGARTFISSVGLLNIPDPAVIQLVKPSIADLVVEGILELANSSAP